MFSLRLGLNTNKQKLPSGVATFDLIDYKTDGVSIKWDRTRIQPWFNYNYALTTDACIYRTHQLYSLISRESYKNLNELESKLYPEAYKMPPMMRSCQNSCCVNIPFNLVQSSIINENDSHLQVIFICRLVNPLNQKKQLTYFFAIHYFLLNLLMLFII